MLPAMDQLSSSGTVLPVSRLYLTVTTISSSDSSELSAVQASHQPCPTTDAQSCSAGRLRTTQCMIENRKTALAAQQWLQQDLASLRI